MLDEIFNGSESEDNYKRNYTSRFNFRIFKIAFNISYVYVYCHFHSYQRPNIFSLEWNERIGKTAKRSDLTNRDLSQRDKIVHAIEATIKESLH